MPRGIHNWTFSDVARFLKDHNFRLNHVTGSHYYYVGAVHGTTRQVCIPFHGKKSIKPRTLKSIVKQSGLPLEDWIDKK